MAWIEWLANNWLMIAIPVLAFFATYVVGLWVRKIAYDAFEGWAARGKWRGSQFIVDITRRACLHWVLLLSAYMATQVSVMPSGGKIVAGKTVGTLLVLSLTWVVITVSEKLLRLYIPRLKTSQFPITLAVNVIRIAFIVVGVLTALEVWGAPTSPILLLLAVAVLVAALVLRDAVPHFFAGMQLSATQQLKVGDYIKLETGEEGYVTQLSWNNTYIKASDESTIIIPNNRLLQNKIINYGHPLKKAKEVFRFNSRTHLTELTGLEASNLHELVDLLKKAPDAVIYYHTHRFLEESHYLTPEPSNDFAAWVTDALGDEVLGERLASVDTFGFPNLGSLRERLVNIIEECLSTGSNLREAMEGREFHFMKSVSVVFPTTYAAHDLREFVEALRKITLGSLYFHVFESRLRLGRGLNDFSIWLRDSLDELELAENIAQLDPYTYTLEGLRSALIQLIEKRIK